MNKYNVKTVAAVMMLTVSTAAMAQQTGASHSAPPQAEQEQPQASTRDVVRQEHTYFGDKFTIVPSIQYSHSDRNQLSLSGFLVLDAIFLGNISVDKASFDTVTASLSFRYDLTDRIQLQATVPYLFRRAHYESTGVDHSTSNSSGATVSDNGLGDISAAIYYHALQETASHPDLVVYAGFRAPTGADPFGIPTVRSKSNDNLEYPTELPMGNGVWSVFGGLSILKTYDPAILFASIGYEHTFPNDFGDISSADGNQPGEIDLGDTFRFGAGMAFALNRKLSLSLSYSHAYTTEAEQTQDGGSTIGIVGSQGSIGTLNLGMTLAVSDDTSLVTNLAVGVTGDAPDVMLSVSMPFNP